MLTPVEKLEVCCRAFELMRGITWHGAAISGEIERTNDATTLFSQLDEEALVQPSADFAAPVPGTWAKLELLPPRSSEAYLARSLPALLSEWSEAHYKAPNALYLADEKELCSFSSPPKREITKAYSQALEIVAMLRELSDYHSTASGRLNLVFLQKEKLEIPVSIDVSQLSLHKSFADCKSLLGDGAHSIQKKTIFKNILLEILKNCHPAERFSRLLSMFDTFFERFRENYQLYVSEFTVDKVLGEISEKKLEYILKLNKVFSDIQSQLLSVPVALILIGGQMENIASVTGKNVVILLGAIVFAWTMSMVIRNQRDNLNAISTEIKGQRERMQKLHPALFEKFEDEYSALEAREEHQRRLSEIVQALVVVSLVGTVVLFTWYSDLIPFGLLKVSH